jgi:hypothetical protein
VARREVASGKEQVTRETGAGSQSQPYLGVTLGPP